MISGGTPTRPGKPGMGVEAEHGNAARQIRTADYKPSADIDRIQDALQFIDASDRETWLRMGMAIKSELADAGFDLWESWSQQAESFNGRDARDVWKSIRAGGGVTIGTLFHEAKQHGWRDDRHHQKPSPEEITERRRIAEERTRREQAEIEAERAETARKAAAVWKTATPAKNNHPYLSRKQVATAPTLREIEASTAADILGYAPKSGGEPLAGRLLVVPVKQGDGLSTLELIDGDGHKAALSGRGTKTGGFWAAQSLPDTDGPEPLLIGEGVATCLSAKEATGYPALAALSSGNLAVVAQAMRQRYPTRPIVILADLVKATGAPDHHAIEAAKAIGARLAVPDFGPDREPGQTDFNDLSQVKGIEAVRRCISAAKPEADSTDPPPVDQLRFCLEDLNKANLTPRCLVEKYLYADVAVLAAAGGTGKTTLSIFEAVHIALGRTLYGLRVANPGAVLFVTAEDRRETFAARLREVMAALGLTDEERRRVLNRFLVWDVSGSDLRLACLQDNMPVVTGLADRIIEAYRDNPPALIVFDPLVSFGADEGRVNANEQAVITAARRIMAGLGCCVRLIAHTGKGNAREGALDQYGFRGGSALADGSRMMTILQPWKPDQSAGGPTPPATLATSARSSITILSRAKLSYCEPQPLLWVARDGWTFSYAVDVRTSPDEAKRGREDQILTFLADQLGNGRRHTRHTLEDCADAMGMKRTQVRSAVSELTVSGRLVEAILPKEQQQGGRKTFLCPAHLAKSDGEIPPQNGHQDDGTSPASTTSPPYRDKNGGEVEPPIFTPFPGTSPNIPARFGEVGEVATEEPPEWVEEEF